MSFVDLPRNCTHAAIIRALASADVLAPPIDRVGIRVPDGCFLSPSGLALLCSWGLLLRQRGGSVYFTGSGDALRYLSRIDLLDFAGVESASSSFLDELLGRLAAEIGLDEFQSRIRIDNATDAIVAMANVVIGQRLQTPSEPLDQ